MAALEAAHPILSSCLPSFTKFPKCPPSPPSIRLLPITSISKPTLFLKSPPLLSLTQTRKLESFKVCSAVEEVAAVEEKSGEEEKTQQPNQRKKLFVQNLSWSLTVEDIKKLFGECGTVADIEIIKHPNGKSRGFAFVTMSSGEEAQTVIDKFDSHELLGRIIKVEFSKRLKRPPRPPPENPPPISPPGETRYKLYVSNLSWSARSSHLREFFAAGFNPVSVRVVFEKPQGRPAGYGFAWFATKEEAESAISALDGKELLGRPIILKFAENKSKESTEGKEEEDISEEPQQS